MAERIDKIGKSRERAAGGAGRVGKGARGEPAETGGVEEAPGAAFSDVLAGVAGGPAEKRLEAILGDIRKLADQLARRRLLEDLEAYRMKVGDFLRACLEEVLSVREASGRKGLSRRKQLLVVKRVNVELEELSRLVLGGAPDFRIMKELGTIEGLLMDLYR